VSVEDVERGADAGKTRSGRRADPGSRRAWIAAIAACAIAGCVIWVAVRSALATSVASERTESAPPVAPAAHPPLPPAPAPAPAPPARVHVLIESEPPEARISIDGEIVGVTPHEHVLERGSTARPFVIEREGYEPFTGEITPETNQRLLVRLTARERRRVRRRFFAFD